MPSASATNGVQEAHERNRARKRKIGPEEILQDVDEADDDSGQQSEAMDEATPPIEASNVYADNIQDFEQLMRSIELDEALDLRYPLARRAHLERLVEARWERKYEEQQDSDQAHADADGVADNLEYQMILRHVTSGSLTSSLRWPLPIAVVPRPRWSLADEVSSIVERNQREQSGVVDKNADRSSNDSDAAVIDEDGDDDDDDDCIDAGPPSLILPVIARCQAALATTLHDIAHRVSPSGGHSKLRRRDIVTWRDVLKTIELRDDIPDAVIAKVEQRLHSIFGSAELIPGAILLNTFSTPKWRCSRILGTISDREPVDLEISERYGSVAGKRARRRGQGSNRKKLDQEFLRSSSFQIPRLAEPPISRRELDRARRERNKTSRG
jgi:hypothetical protein